MEEWNVITAGLVARVRASGGGSIAVEPCEFREHQAAKGLGRLVDEASKRSPGILRADPSQCTERRAGDTGFRVTGGFRQRRYGRSVPWRWPSAVAAE